MVNVVRSMVGRKKKLTEQQVETLYSRKLKEGLFPGSIRNIHTVLHKALSHAVRTNLVARNVCDVVELPHLRQDEMKPLTKEQAYIMLETAKEYHLETLLLVAITTGMRRGELLGLKWQDRDLVFCSKNGNYLAPNYLVYRFHRLLDKAGLPDMRFHNLRHSAAAFLLAMGVHVKIVQELLGHSNISMTLGTYSHVLPGLQKEAMEKWNNWLGKYTDGKNEQGVTD